MQFLPSQLVGRSAWRLPLAERSAAALAEALLASERSTRVDLLQSAMVEDPALALWGILGAQRLHPPNVLTLHDLAGFLAANLVIALDRSKEPPLTSSPGETATARRWADLTFRGVAVASAAAGPSNEPERAHQGQVYLLGLLHGAVDWLSSTGPAMTLADCRAHATGLPGWLETALVRIEEASPESPRRRDAPEIVAEAIDRLFGEGTGDGSGGSSDDAAPFDAEAHRAAGNHARRRFTAAVPGAGRCLQALVEKLNRLEQLAAEFDALLQREKIDSLKEFAYGAGHEINNPLANISTRAQSLLRDETDPERRRKLATINSQAIRAHEMIADMMLFARPPALQWETVNAAALIDGLIEELAPAARQQETQILRTGDSEGPILRADPQQLTAALRAMCTNSLEAIGHGGRIEMAAQPSNGRVEIVVRDTGPGITPEVRRHLFDPFFSGREAGRGLGFGLSKCWRIVEDHGGEIKVESEPGRGATFTIILPETQNHHGVTEDAEETQV